jgi:hypothetical protein
LIRVKLRRSHKAAASRLQKGVSGCVGASWTAESSTRDPLARHSTLHARRMDLSNRRYALFRWCSPGYLLDPDRCIPAEQQEATVNDTLDTSWFRLRFAAAAVLVFGANAIPRTPAPPAPRVAIAATNEAPTTQGASGGKSRKLFLHTALVGYTVSFFRRPDHVPIFAPKLPTQARPRARLVAPHLGLALSSPSKSVTVDPLPAWSVCRECTIASRKPLQTGRPSPG